MKYRCTCPYCKGNMSKWVELPEYLPVYQHSYEYQACPACGFVATFARKLPNIPDQQMPDWLSDLSQHNGEYPSEQ